VTIAQFGQFVAATGYETLVERGLQSGHLRKTRLVTPDASREKDFETSFIRDDASWRAPHGRRAPVFDPRTPVVCIAWEDAREYAAWAGLELPSDAQWEHAAAGERESLFPWGDEAPKLDGQALCNTKNSAYFGWSGELPSLPFGAVASDVSELGVHDMAGNVVELCDDDWDPDFPRKLPPRPLDPLCTVSEGQPRQHATRGGCWNDGPHSTPTYRRGCEYRALDDTGFRMAYSLSADLRKRKAR
jgi:formylglycine-generating enzyme